MVLLLEAIKKQQASLFKLSFKKDLSPFSMLSKFRPDITKAFTHSLAKRTLSDFQKKQMEMQKAYIWPVTSFSATWAALESSWHSQFLFAYHTVN